MISSKLGASWGLTWSTYKAKEQAELKKPRELAGKWVRKEITLE